MATQERRTIVQHPHTDELGNYLEFVGYELHVTAGESEADALEKIVHEAENLDQQDLDFLSMLAERYRYRSIPAETELAHLHIEHGADD